MERTASREASLHPDTLKTVLAFVLAGGKGERLYPLTKDRSKPAVPRYQVLPTRSCGGIV